tara:strand:- start:1208 stop:1723 length:516 start_codon:yes stop_codon:yes gene_type:complete
MNEDDEKDFVLNIYYSTKGNLDQINAAIDARVQGNRTRKITVFENFIISRLSMNPKILKMPNMEISPVEATYLSIYPGIDRIEVLDLRQNFIGDEGTRALAISPLLKGLKSLDLRSNLITRQGLLALIASKNMGKLEILDLRLNKLGGQLWLERLNKSGNFNDLLELKIGG